MQCKHLWIILIQSPSFILRALYILFSAPSTLFTSCPRGSFSFTITGSAPKIEEVSGRECASVLGYFSSFCLCFSCLSITVQLFSGKSLRMRHFISIISEGIFRTLPVFLRQHLNHLKNSSGRYKKTQKKEEKNILKRKVSSFLCQNTFYHHRLMTMY